MSAIDDHVRLHCKLLGSPIMQNDGLCRLWIHCLLKASPRTTKIVIPGTNETFTLARGSFITDRISLHKELHPARIARAPSDLTVWRYLQSLESFGCLQIANLNNRCSLVTVLNFDVHQGLEESEPADNRATFGAAPHQIAADYFPDNAHKALAIEVSELIVGVANATGATALEVHDTLGLGHVSVAPRPVLEQAKVTLLERLERCDPRPADGTNWITVKDPFHWLVKLPEVACCYAFYSQGRILYVGSTECLRKRNWGLKVRLSDNGADTICTTPWGEFVNVYLKYRPTKKLGDWPMIEYRLIRRLQPPGNKRGIITQD